MRRILLDHARDKKAGKRGGGDAIFLNVEDVQVMSTERSDDSLLGRHALEQPREDDAARRSPERRSGGAAYFRRAVRANLDDAVAARLGALGARRQIARLYGYKKRNR